MNEKTLAAKPTRELLTSYTRNCSSSRESSSKTERLLTIDFVYSSCLIIMEYYAIYGFMDWLHVVK